MSPTSVAPGTILEQRAEALHSLLAFAPRAFVIEFAGTPKSGKSTSVEAIRHFFSRHGFRVHVLAERAAVCPIPMKGHLFFNTWCAASMLAELLANVEAEADIVIVDRGIFDALVWLTMQRQRGEVTHDEAQTIEAFLLLERWRALIDLVIVMNVSPEQALERENSQRITSKLGSIMNPDVLAVVSDSVKNAFEAYASKFKAAVDHNTSGTDIKEASSKLADKIIGLLSSFLNPNILVVAKRELVKLPLQDGGNFESKATGLAMACISEHGRFIPRAQAERDDEYVQIIPCGILVHNQQIFVFQRKERDPKYALYGRTTILQATHVPERTEQSTADLLTSSLRERISRSLFLSRVFSTDVVGYCWQPDDVSINRHFAMVYRVNIDNERTATDLRKKEFRSWRGHSVAGEFVTWEKLAEDKDELRLEAWSQTILRGLPQAQLRVGT
jgi:thymidylate kinase/predicted NUDIX family phosphoesterase